MTHQRDRLTDAYQIGALALDPFRTRIQALEENRVAVELTLAEIKTEMAAIWAPRPAPGLACRSVVRMANRHGPWSRERLPLEAGGWL